MEPEFDILILGAGLVGSSLAIALEGRGFRVGLLESSLPGIAPPGFDERKLALADASINALRALEVLDDASTLGPIRRIHVSRAGDFGAVRLRAQDWGREAFGAVIPASQLGAALERKLATLGDLRLIRPATVTGIETQPDFVRVHVWQSGAATALEARLLVAADGTKSFARTALAIGADEHDYRQVLLVCSLAADRPADGTAYERFTNDGPVALLPMGRDYGAICAVAAEQADAIRALDDADFVEYFQQRFGWRAGRLLRAGSRSAYPIARVVADRQVSGRTVLIGNAAQTIHPIGAQGFNLGLRDALTLAQGIDPVDPGSDASLARYVEDRREDRERTLAFSDGLARLTSNPSFALQVGRSFGLLALSHVPGLTAPLVAGAMGYRGKVPDLARKAQ